MGLIMLLRCGRHTNAPFLSPLSGLRELTFSQAVILVSESDFALLPLANRNAAWTSQIGLT